MTRARTHHIVFAALVALATFGVTPAHASVILLNFGGANSTIGGNGSLDVGGTWNNITSPNADLAAGSVVDTSNATVTGVSVTTNGFRTTDGAGGVFTNTGTWAGSELWVDLDAAANTWFYGGTDTTPATIVIAGLGTSPYRLDYLAIRSSGGDSDRTADYVVNGSFGDSTPNGDDFNANSDGWDTGDVLGWSSVAPIGGQITITITKLNTSNFGYATALRLTEVPAPAALPAGALLLAALAARRRRVA